MDEDTKNYISDEELTNYNDDNLLKSNVMFFDNDLNNFNGFNDSINILINDSIPNQIVRDYYVNSNTSIPKQIPFAKIVQEINQSNNHNNQYINVLVDHGMYEMHIPVEGFTERHINIVKKWINAPRKKNDLYLLFDWDRTLSVCEGIVFMSIPFINRYYSDNKDHLLPDILNLLIGGQERYDMLKKFFNEICQIPNLQILVITANPSAENTDVNYRNFFEMVKLLIPCLTEEHFLCSSSSSKSKVFDEYRSRHKDSKKDDSKKDNDSKKDDSKKRKYLLNEKNEKNVKKSRKRGGRKNRAIKSRRYKR